MSLFNNHIRTKFKTQNVSIHFLLNSSPGNTDQCISWTLNLCQLQKILGSVFVTLRSDEALHKQKEEKDLKWLPKVTHPITVYLPATNACYTS